MDRSPIGRTRHEPVEDVELTNEVPLADAANRRVARHLPRIFGPKREQSDARAPASRGSRSFASGMAGADHQDVVHRHALADQSFT
jgi:hypothetical protein